MNVVVPLQHNDAAIAAYEASLNDPSSSSYEQWLTPDQFQAKFDAPAANVATVRNYVTRDGLQLYNTGGLGDLTEASGTAAQVEQTFGVTLHNYVASDGTHFFANVNAPTVPSGVGVVGVLGLQNLLQMKDPKAKPGPETRLTPTEGQCVPGVACTGPLGPTDLWSVYDQPSTDMGNGESIGIIGEGQTADVIPALRRFEATRNLPDVPVQVYWTDPAPKTDDSGRVEWELDTQASTGMAPDVSQLRLYFGSDLSVGGLAPVSRRGRATRTGRTRSTPRSGSARTTRRSTACSAPPRRRAASRSRRRRPRDARSSPPPATPARAARSSRPPSTASRTGRSRPPRIRRRPERHRRGRHGRLHRRRRATRSASTSTPGTTPAAPQRTSSRSRTTRAGSRRWPRTLRLPAERHAVRPGPAVPRHRRRGRALR